ncbi:MAG: hypothetical protein J1F35_01905 [Erysipelotrichales bacterium]|nr:hypothetical protein [Erysipelotrichales bacterium]
MRIISFGDLFIDYYLNNDLVLGICGGKTNANILANLSKYFDTAFFGVVGNDTQGRVAVDSLKKLGCDISHIETIDEKTKSFFIDNKGYSTTCPYCGRKLSYHGFKFEEESVLSSINDDDMIVVDNLNVSTMNIINKVNNKAFLDIGYLGNLLYISLDELEELLASRFEIINMNESVYKVLRKKFQIDSVDLYELLKPKILIITRGKKGADIIYDGILVEKEIEEAANEVEISGAGDSFFSEFIRTLIESNFEVNEKIISLAYMRASSISRFVVMNYGARTHLEPLYKIDNYHECICNDIEVSSV